MWLNGGTSGSVRQAVVRDPVPQALLEFQSVARKSLVQSRIRPALHSPHPEKQLDQKINFRPN